MFQSARVKLTVWYALISVIVSAIFSLALYTITERQLEINRSRWEFRLRILRDLNPTFIPPPNVRNPAEDTQEVEDILKLQLFYVNVIVAVLASLAGYFLAGRSLKPIKESVDKQQQFIADASHELRTPLTALKTAIEVSLRDKKLDLKQAKLVLKDNLLDVNTLKALSENLLMLATLQKSNLAAFENTSLSQILKESAVKVNYLAKEKNITLRTSFQDAAIHGDRQKLIDLFVIFLDNAIKYSPEKSTINFQSKIADSTAIITVKDRGTGIDEEDRPHIFERFYRAEKSRSASYAKGYGLGLAIAKEIINLHKGQVDVASQLQKGTTFTIRLPVRK